MKKNQSNNKFKLVKWKNKLVPTLFGTIGSLVPIVSMSSQGSGSGESAKTLEPQAPPQKEVVDPSRLNLSLFSVSGKSGSGVITKDDSKIPPQVKVEYAKINDGLISNYSITSPNDLKNGDKISIKFSIKEINQFTHAFPSTFKKRTIEFLVEEKLQKIVVVTTHLIASSFDVTGEDGKGKMAIKTPLPLEVEVKYVKKKDNSQPNEGDYQSVVPSDLSNGDKVFIKFYINDSYKKDWVFPSSGFTNPIIFTVDGLKTQAQLNTVLNAINGLDKNDFISIYDATAKNKLASDNTNKDDKKDAIVTMIRGKISDNALKALINADLISFDSATEGTLKIKINLVPFGGIDKKVIDITGFKTQAELDKMEANKAIMEAKTLFNGLKNADPETPTNLPAKATTLPSKLKTDGATTATTIGFNNPLEKEDVDDKGVIAAFSVKDVDDANGKLKVEVTLSKAPGKSEKFKFTLIGYQTTAEAKVAADADITAAKALFNGLKNADPETPTNLPAKATTLPSKLETDGATTATTIGFNNPLEKDGVDPKGVTATFSIKSVDDANGKLKVEATLSKTPGDAQTVEFTLTGYQTTAEAKVAADADITAAKALFNGLKNAESGTKTKLDSSSTTLPSKLETDGAASATDIGFDNPLEKDGVDAKGVTATFSIKSVDDANGKLKVEATLSKTPGDAQTVEFTLTGYQTTAEANKVAADADITAAKALFDGLKNAESGTKTKLDSSSTTLPSKLETDGAASATDIGFDNPLEKDGVDAKGVTATFSIKSVDDVNGKLVVKAILSKASGDAQTVEFTLTGYQTTAEANKVAANKAIMEAKALFDILKNADPETQTNLPAKATTLPSKLETDGATTAADIGFNNPLEKDGVDDKGVIAAFSVKDVDDANGKLKVEVTLSKAPGKSEKFKFTLIGYQTTAEAKVAADEDIMAVKALFNGLKNADPETPTNLPAKATTLPSKLKTDGATTAADIGFDNPLEKDGVDPKGVTATFSVKDVDDAKGTLVVEATLSKTPGDAQTVEFTLIGYQTTAEANEVKEATEAIKAAKALFSKLISDETQTNLPAKATTLPSKLETDGAASATTIGFDNPLEKDGVDAKGVTATFSIKSVDDVNGKLVVEATLSKTPGDAQTVEFTLTGYQTTAEANKVAADADITAAKALFDGLKNAESGTKTKLDSSSTTLPSKLETDGAASATDIGFDNPLEKDGVDAKGVTATFSIKSVDDVNGKLVVKAILSKASGDAQTVEFTLTGYQTTAEANKVAADADITAAKVLFDGLKNAESGTKTKLDSSSTTLPSKLETDGAASATDIGFDNPLEKDGVDAKGVTATFSIKSVDDVNGKLVVKATLSKTPGDAQTVEFTLIGYQTTAEAKVAADEDIMAVKALFDGLKNGESGTKTKLDSSSTTLPSKLETDGATTAADIGFDNPLEKDGVDPKGVTATFSVKDVDDAKGTLVVEATLSKTPGDVQTVEFTLTGYQKASPSKTSGLSKGVIAGITIGASVVTLGIAFIVFRFLKLKKSK